MKKKRTIEIEYEWFEPGTIVMRKEKESDVPAGRYRVKRCFKPGMFDDDAAVTAKLEGLSPTYLTEDLVEVPQNESNLRENESIELKPCPFCGSGNIECVRHCCSNTLQGLTYGRVVRCFICGAKTDIHSSDGRAVEVWNRRVNN